MLGAADAVNTDLMKKELHFILQPHERSTFNEII